MAEERIRDRAEKLTREVSSTADEQMNQEYHHSLDGIPMPGRIAKLPIDPERKLPVPWFVHFDENGKPDFRIIGANKPRIAVSRKLCWICGEPLGKFLAFAIGCMCAVNRVSSEPPAHRDCAEFSVRACPFLSHPEAHRREHGLGPLSEENCPGIPIARNPGVTAIWITHSFRVFDAGNGQLIRVGDPLEVTWWCRGRAATRDEALHSIATGEGALREMAERQGAAAIKVLDQQLKDAFKLLPLPTHRDGGDART